MWYISCEFAFFDSENTRDMYSMTPNLLNFFLVSGYEKNAEFYDDFESVELFEK
jgi:hypothetical protein